MEPSPCGQAVLYGSMAVGLCLLLFWLARRALHPGKLTLAQTPGRDNSISLLHMLVLALLTIILSQIGARVYLHSTGQSEIVRQMLQAEEDGSGDEIRSDRGIDQATRDRAEGAVAKAQLVGGIIGQPVLTIVCIVAAGWLFRLGPVRGLGLSGRHWFFDALRGVMAGLAVFPVCYGLGMLGTNLIPPNLQQPHMILVFVRQQTSPLWLAIAFAVAVLAAPVLEEILWRGYFQSMLRRWLGPWPAILIASGVFSAIHLSTGKDWPPRGWEAMAPLFVLAVTMGYNYERTGRLMPSIVIHMIFNAIGMVVTVL